MKDVKKQKKKRKIRLENYKVSYSHNTRHRLYKAHNETDVDGDLNND